MTARDIRLRAAAKAGALLYKLGLLDAITEGLERIDIFEVLQRLDIPVVCKPLAGLQGALIQCDGQHGIILSTNTSVHRQRYTAAHELGHYIFGHGEALDDDSYIGRGPMGKKIPTMEREAEAFASEFLAPKALIANIARRQAWKKEDLDHPETSYQLSLRMGLSYTAICLALRSHGFIDINQLDRLLKVKPRDIKRNLSGNTPPENLRNDIYVIYRNSAPRVLKVKPNDRVIFELPERASSGYRWHISYDGISPQTVEDSTHYNDDTQLWGGLSSRTITLENLNPGTIHLSEIRPWEDKASPADALELAIESDEVEKGLPKVFRQ